MSVNNCCCIITGINPDGASTTNTTVDVSPESAPCKQLDYQDYANYFIVMSGDLLGNCFHCFVLVCVLLQLLITSSTPVVQTFVRHTK